MWKMNLKTYAVDRLVAKSNFPSGTCDNNYPQQLHPWPIFLNIGYAALSQNCELSISNEIWLMKAY